MVRVWLEDGDTLVCEGETLDLLVDGSGLGKMRIPRSGSYYCLDCTVGPWYGGMEFGSGRVCLSVCFRHLTLEPLLSAGCWLIGVDMNT